MERLPENYRGVAAVHKWLHDTNSAKQDGKSATQSSGIEFEIYEQSLRVGEAALPIIRRHERAFSVKLGESLARFRLWKEFFPANIIRSLPGGHDELGATMLRILFRVGKCLVKLMFHLEHRYKRQKLFSFARELNSLLERVEYSVEDNNEDPGQLEWVEPSESADSEAGDEASISITEIVSAIDIYSWGMMELGPAIRRACTDNSEDIEIPLSPRDQTFKLHTPAAAFVSLILDRFKNADPRIAQRLGEANWQRFERIRMAMAGDKPFPVTELMEALKIGVESIFEPTPTFHDSGIGYSLPLSTYCSSSFASTSSELGGMSARVPPTPKEVRHGKDFRCSICNRRVSNVRNRFQWKAHVFMDLQPYICIHPKCSNRLLTFPTLDTWVAHVFREHERSFCGVEDSNSFELEVNTDESSFMQIDGIQHELTGALPYAQLTCPLCRTSISKSQRVFARHLAGHFESISLACLPKEPDSEVE